MDTIDQIKPLMEMSLFVKALIYGDPGVGKTVFACNSPAPLLLDCDGTGALSLLNHPEINARTKVLQVRSFNQMVEVLEALRRGDPRLADRETVVIDTLSELAKKHLDEFIAKERITNKTRDPVAYQRDYKFNTEAMRQFITWMLQVEKNLVVLSHATEEKDERTGIIKVRPFLTPRLAGTMEGVFDVFGYMTAETDPEFNVQRVLQIMPTRNVKAKTRIGGLPPMILDPIFQHFINRKAMMMEENRQYQEQLQAAMQPPPAPTPPAEPVFIPENTTPQPVQPVEEPVSGADPSSDTQQFSPLAVGATFTLTSGSDTGSEAQG